MKTFRDLRDRLNRLTADQLDSNIAVETDDEDEVYSVTSPFNSLDIRVEAEDGILHKGHPVMVWKQDLMPVLIIKDDKSDVLGVYFDDASDKVDSL